MMNFLQSLLSAAPQGGAVATAAPLTSPLVINGAAAAKTPEGAPVADYNKQQAMSGLLGAMTSGGVNAIGNMHGGQEQQGQMIQAPMYQGGGRYQSSGAGNISKMRMANGLLAQR